MEEEIINQIINQIQEAQRVPYRINPRRNTPRHILIKLTKTKHKEEILKATREKQQLTIQGKPHTFKIKKITRNKEGHYIMIKGSIQEEDIIVNIYEPNIGAPQYISQTLTDIKGEIDSNTVKVGDLITHSHQWTDYQNRKLIRKHES